MFVLPFSLARFNYFLHLEITTVLEMLKKKEEKEKKKQAALLVKVLKKKKPVKVQSRTFPCALQDPQHFGGSSAFAEGYVREQRASV